MENMSFDDLGLLLEVIEMQMVLHILVHGLRFSVLQCDIFTYSVSILIHSFYAYLKYKIALVLTWSRSMYYNCFILYLLLMQLDLFAACGVHRSYCTCFVCGLIYSLLCVTMLWLQPMFVPSLCSSTV
jgi:hypothetical protein